MTSSGSQYLKPLTPSIWADTSMQWEMPDSTLLSLVRRLRKKPAIFITQSRPSSLSVCTSENLSNSLILVTASQPHSLGLSIATLSFILLDLSMESTMSRYTLSECFVKVKAHYTYRSASLTCCKCWSIPLHLPPHQHISLQTGPVVRKKNFSTWVIFHRTSDHLHASTIKPAAKMKLYSVNTLWQETKSYLTSQREWLPDENISIS